MDELGTTAHSFDREIRVVCQTTTREALSRVTYNGLDKLKVYFQNKENNEILNLLKTFTVDSSTVNEVIRGNFTSIKRIRKTRKIKRIKSIKSIKSIKTFNKQPSLRCFSYA